MPEVCLETGNIVYVYGSPRRETSVSCGPVDRRLCAFADHPFRYARARSGRQDATASDARRTADRATALTVRPASLPMDAQGRGACRPRAWRGHAASRSTVWTGREA